MHRLLYAVFFLSGAAALIFETLWFNLAGLAFGNSVVASSLVLASFMGGLALGNALVGRYGDRLGNPIRAYCVLEVLIAIVGVALILLFPVLNDVFAPLFRRFLDTPWVLNPLRLSLGFGLLLIPASAMGATLPIMVKGLNAIDAGFGKTLGVLYGVNTLGAVAGVVVCEWVLIGRFGIRGSGFIAAGADLVAAAAALALLRYLPSRAPASAPKARVAADPPLSPYARRLLAAAFLAGGALLALEVVWFRFLLLFMFGSSTNFALVLAVVLTGIAVGGFVASRWPARLSGARSLPLIALLAATLVVVTYALFTSASLGFSADVAADLRGILPRALRLMFPVSLLSGMLFTLGGHAIYREMTDRASETRAAGYLTLANTTGAMLGALVGGFVLLPVLGIGAAFFTVALTYVTIALLTCRLRDSPTAGRTNRWLLAGGLAASVLALGLFPFDYLQRAIVPAVVQRFPFSQLVEAREGLLQTIIYLRRDHFGQPFDYRMLTDGHSMSGTQERSRRYMKFYVYLPVALHPNPKKALLISYGVGSTAKALTDTRSLERIDVVDISRNILEMSTILYPRPEDHPLEDSRVRVQIEDGRFFLQVTENKYDLITAEPPPLKAASIHRLYSKEYFELLHDRLEDGGMATYWLPIYQLDQSDYRAIVRGFCEAFTDCSLWTGSGAHWMLFGAHNATERVDDGQFAAQWRDEVVGPELRALGFERPEQLGALYIDDGPGLRERCRDTPPLVDDFPYRLSPIVSGEFESSYRELMEIEPARARFDGSEQIRRLWPDAMRGDSLPFFEYRHVLNDVLRVNDATATGDAYHFDVLHDLLTESSLETLPLWWMGSGNREQEIIDGLPPEGLAQSAVDSALGARALVERDYLGAAAHYQRAFARRQRTDFVVMEILSLGLAGKTAEAAERVASLQAALPGDTRFDRYWQFLEETFGLEID